MINYFELHTISFFLATEIKYLFLSVCFYLVKELNIEIVQYGQFCALLDQSCGRYFTHQQKKYLLLM